MKIYRALLIIIIGLLAGIVVSFVLTNYGIPAASIIYLLVGLAIGVLVKEKHKAYQLAIVFPIFLFLGAFYSFIQLIDLGSAGLVLIVFIPLLALGGPVVSFVGAFLARLFKLNRF
ncbi:MAG: hypothetical protein UX31_C0006G0019 [Candidatus Nomurabacteria bacterium GW2011_GWA1_46_11]|uniref:Uncharacterized protein n=2 Tax=Parcubacteria group TaxID=1794811 RepID=A0A1G1YVW3_9BACT|nr:MAG: hypothetical protein UX29_C0004G0029 [Parcubacteria group bacterium GW2011_GWA2_46_10]KKU22107.1 MAG: hypothetical protein UX31_C0006G0019 [Candidatus Nomurabacteria bacterium GW2011_GWA1_46_11]OGY56369.1 MAG: hypothetical protein A2119_02500 [Candidatus Colwellbacteria bacterium GWA2_46_10]